MSDGPYSLRSQGAGYSVNEHINALMLGTALETHFACAKKNQKVLFGIKRFQIIDELI